MKTVLIIVVALGVGYWIGASLAISEAQKSVALFMQSPEGVESCRQLVRSAGG